MSEEIQSKPLSPDKKKKVDDKERRRELLERFKAQKQNQIEKNIRFIQRKPVEERKRSLTEREKKALQAQNLSWSNSNAPNPVQPVNVAMLKVNAETVTRNIPALVQAQSVQNLEITRLTNDPMFGDMNKAQILNADKIIKENRFKGDSEIQLSSKELKTKVKHPMTKHDFKLREEHRKIEKCEKLVS